MAQNLYPKQKDGRFGYIDTLNQWVIPAQFEQAGFYVQKKAIASRHDSLFLIINKDLILYLSDLKNYKTVNSNHFAVQHKNGRWAIADSSFRPVTGFDYTKINGMDSFYQVWQNQQMGLLGADFNLLFPCLYTSIQKLGNGYFKAKSADMESIYAYRDSMVLMMQNTNLVYENLHPKIYQSLNKNRTKLVIFNLMGDSIYGCRKCQVVQSFGNYIFVQEKDAIHMLDARTGTEKRVLGNFSEIMTENRTPGFLYLYKEKEMYMSDRDEPLFTKELLTDTVEYMNSKNLFVKRSGLWGIYDYSGNVVLPCAYHTIRALNDSMIEGVVQEKKDLYYLPLRKKILTVSPWTFLSIDETSILAYNYEGSSKLYEMNSDMKLTDSAEFRALKIMTAGKKTRSISSGPANTGNTSLSDRWFFHRERYGLKGFNNDTLIKPRFTSIHAINDSLDIITCTTGSRRIRLVEGAGWCHVNGTYGIVNNRTGKYIVPPLYCFIDMNQFDDSSFSVIRVITRAGNFALLDKTSYQLVDGTVCSYISDEEEGYMRLFYQARFFSKADYPEKKTGKLPQLFSSIERFWRMGQIDTRRRNIFVYISSAAVNIADKKGGLYWEKSEAIKLNYVLAGKHDNFICVAHNNQFGVMSAQKGLIVPHQYSYVSRLPGDDRYFVLKTNNKKYGYINAQGVELSEAVFSSANDFRDDYAWCKRGDSMVLINRAGDILETGLPLVQVSDVSEGYTSYRMKKGWFLMDVDGQQVGTMIFKKLRPFINGAAAAMQKNTWGIIDKTGQWLFDPEFENFECENTRILVFLKNDYFHFYNRQGQFLNKIKAKGHLKPLGNDYFAMAQNGAVRIFHENGDLFKKRKYRQEIRCTNDTIMIVSNGSIVFYSTDGKKIKRYQHKGGARAIDKGMLEMQRNKQNETTLTLKVAESQRQLHKDVYDISNVYIRLIKPDIFIPVKLVNIKLHECFRYNAFIYEYEINSQKRFVLSDSLGNLLNEQHFSVLEYFENGMFKASFYNQNNTFSTGILNFYGLWIIEPKFHEIKPFHAGVAIYAKLSDFLIADENGRLITEDILVDYTRQGGYYCLKTEDKMAWWHPDKGWLCTFSK